MDFALWTRAAVGQLIESELQIKLSGRGVGVSEVAGFHTPEADQTRI
jgi:hypothetical protein